MERVLLVVDLQKQFRPVDFVVARDGYCQPTDVENYFERAEKYVIEHGKDYNKVYATYFRQDINANINFRDNLSWEGCMETSYDDLTFLNYLNFPVKVFEKNSYAGALGIKRHCTIDIVGGRLESSVLSICFRFFDAGFTGFRVLTKYCYTGGFVSREEVIKLLKYNFGKCVC